MEISMYVCIQTYVHTRVCLCVDKCTKTYFHLQTYIHFSIFVRICAHTDPAMDAWHQTPPPVHSHTHVRACAHVQTHTHTLMQVHTRYITCCVRYACVDPRIKFYYKMLLYIYIYIQCYYKILHLTKYSIWVFCSNIVYIYRFIYIYTCITYRIKCYYKTLPPALCPPSLPPLSPPSLSQSNFRVAALFLFVPHENQEMHSSHPLHAKATFMISFFTPHSGRPYCDIHKMWRNDVTEVMHSHHIHMNATRLKDVFAEYSLFYRALLQKRHNKHKTYQRHQTERTPRRLCRI